MEERRRKGLILMTSMLVIVAVLRWLPTTGPWKMLGAALVLAGAAVAVFGIRHEEPPTTRLDL